MMGDHWVLERNQTRSQRNKRGERAEIRSDALRLWSTICQKTKYWYDSAGI